MTEWIWLVNFGALTWNTFSWQKSSKQNFVTLWPNVFLSVSPNTDGKLENVAQYLVIFEVTKILKSQINVDSTCTPILYMEYEKMESNLSSYYQNLII